ncbi:hypothetical protein LEP1GSC024_1127 [Leptospira noguchii str. 2001034031]|uniref:Uncharacterized protein n=1 Tax=Leptospira noguchii str. 2001034031 TaxID=1193053 RepID=M6Y7D7_9LEPT|nr:hypothetical protein LEP1GSC024_1127 [Leptospira noguchii str. 2001034031]
MVGGLSDKKNLFETTRPPGSQLRSINFKFLQKTKKNESQIY